MKTNLYVGIAITCFGMTSTWAHAAPMATDKIDIYQREFELEIGYDAALLQHVGNEVVRFD